MSELDDTVARLTQQAVDHLSRGADEATAARIRDDLPQIAALLALEWLTGERRFETISQQTQHWLTVMYERVYIDEEPRATDIFARFDLPLSRSQYLARMLPAQLDDGRSASRAAAVRAAARAELTEAFTPHLDGITDANAKQKPIEVSVTRAAYDELLAVLDAEPSGSGEDLVRPPQRTASTPARVYFTIRGYTVRTVLRVLRADTE